MEGRRQGKDARQETLLTELMEGSDSDTGSALGPLRIADDLLLPLEAVTETFSILAMKGAGVTYRPIRPADEIRYALASSKAQGTVSRSV
jgi:hypothetical protein